MIGHETFNLVISNIYIEKIKKKYLYHVPMLLKYSRTPQHD